MRIRQRKTPVLVGTLLIMMLGISSYSETNSQHLKCLLIQQKFSGVLDSGVTLTSLGSMRCGDKSLRVIYYEWNEPGPRPGLAQHASYRVLFMEGSVYLGHYTVEDKPVIRDDILRFPYSKSGYMISCKKDGVLPESIVLDGQPMTLQK